MLLDSGSDEHVFPEDWSSETDVSVEGLENARLRDLQGHAIKQMVKRKLCCSHVCCDAHAVETESHFFLVSDYGGTAATSCRRRSWSVASRRR